MGHGEQNVSQPIDMSAKTMKKDSSTQQYVFDCTLLKREISVANGRKGNDNCYVICVRKLSLWLVVFTTSRVPGVETKGLIQNKLKLIFRFCFFSTQIHNGGSYLDRLFSFSPVYDQSDGKFSPN